MPKIPSVLVRPHARVFACGVALQPAGTGVARGHDDRVLLRLAYLTVTNTFAVLRLVHAR
jgi:hypothetical protein